MATVILVIHLLLAIALVLVVLMQRSEGGGLGMGGGGGGGFMSGRATANLLSRTTGILAACFIATSLGLALIANAGKGPKSVLDRPMPASSGPAVPVESGATPPANAPAPAQPQAPAAPSVPQAPAAPMAK